MPKQDNAVIAATFRNAVKNSNDIVVARLAYQIEDVEIGQRRNGKIEDDLNNPPYTRVHVVMFDEINQIAVLEDIHAAKKGPYKYLSALYSKKLEKWYSTSSYQKSVELAYMHGVAEMRLGQNNQFTIFAERMLTEVKE
jgi:hypothetical protein